jgi:hypothetical protein
VTVVVALQAHGAVNAGHRIEHSLDFPGLAYIDTAAVDHDHHPGDHDHEAPDNAPPEPAMSGDAADAAGDERPIHHHSHSSGDVQLALSTPSTLLPVNPLLTANPDPLPETLPSGLSDDGPSHPPKQPRLIA